MSTQPYEPIKINRDVPPFLAGLVTRISGYEERGANLDGAVEIATLTIPLIINFGKPFAISLDPRSPPAPAGSFIAGIHPGTVTIGSGGEAACIQVDFTPLGARRYFGLPMSELGSRLCPLGDLEDKPLAALIRRLSSCPYWPARWRMLDEFLLDRIARILDLPAPKSAPAFAMLAREHGAIPIRRITEEMGWSRKRLVRTFEEEIGSGPKLVARIMRFRHAVDLLREQQPQTLADIALACGYSDQSHMTREFADFAGRPPAAWLSSVA